MKKLLLTLLFLPTIISAQINYKDIELLGEDSNVSGELLKVWTVPSEDIYVISFWGYETYSSKPRYSAWICNADDIISIYEFLDAAKSREDKKGLLKLPRLKDYYTGKKSKLLIEYDNGIIAFGSEGNYLDNPDSWYKKFLVHSIKLDIILPTLIHKLNN